MVSGPFQAPAVVETGSEHAALGSICDGSSPKFKKLPQRKALLKTRVKPVMEKTAIMLIILLRQR